MGSLTGAVASKRVTEASKGSLRMVGNHSKSTKAEGSLTARPTGRAGTKAKNFSMEDMKEGIAFAHAHGVKVYVTANILAHNQDLTGVRAYFAELKEIGPDALIISDPGVYRIAMEVCPEIERHISTQANNTNYGTYQFWYEQGAKRVVTARELSLEEIREIREHIPDEMEIETFIHGAM